VHALGGAWELADEAVHRTLALTPRLDDALDLAVTLHNQAWSLLQIGDADLANELLGRCLPLYREHSPYPIPVEWLHSAGALALARGEPADADALFREGLERYLTVKSTEELPVTAVRMYEGLAVAAALVSRNERALRLTGIAETARNGRKLGPEDADEEQAKVALSAARAALPPAEADAAERAGSALDPVRALRYAVSDVWEHRSGGAGSPPGGRGPGASPLSGPEHQLARFVAEGLTNRQIAARMRITERSVESALRAIRARLRLRSRAQLAAWSAEHLEAGQPGAGRPGGSG
jgi:DNA-binding CsgD family transcriptional regulator